MKVVQICFRDDRGRRAPVFRCGLLVIVEERDHSFELAGGVDA